MNEIHQKYTSLGIAHANDFENRSKLDANLKIFDDSIIEANKQFTEFELAKTRAAKTKRNVLNDLERYLIEFEANFQRNGGKVIWAVDADEALKAVVDIINTFGVKNTIKTKSTTCQEINLTPTLSAMGLDWTETDSASYYLQLLGEEPMHSGAPLLIKTKEEIANAMHKKFGISSQSSPAELALFMRTQLRDKFIKSDVVITDANFLVVDTGSVSISDNEGNVALGISTSKIHIVLVGIEKILPSIKDLDLFLSLHASHSTGFSNANYNLVLSGPRQEEEIDGPQEMFVILLDNGRSKVLSRDPQKDAMSCIDCGACLNVCQVYKAIGGDAYQSVFKGPIGAVITPLMFGFENYGHLNYACTLCEQCDEVCPVQIPLSKLLLYNRRDFVKEGFSDKQLTKRIKGFKYVMNNRWILDKSSSKIRNYGLKLALKNDWGTSRQFPKVAEQSFAQFMKKNTP